MKQLFNIWTSFFVVQCFIFSKSKKKKFKHLSHSPNGIPKELNCLDYLRERKLLCVQLFDKLWIEKTDATDDKYTKQFT